MILQSNKHNNEIVLIMSCKWSNIGATEDNSQPIWSSDVACGRTLLKILGLLEVKLPDG
jgi:hypothetical protein